MRYPTAKVEQTRNGCIVTVKGHGYTITAEWDGSTNQYGGCRFKAELRADGYEVQRSMFTLAPGQYPDDPDTVAEMACSLFSIGECDVDEEFWTPHPEAHHDLRWIAETCMARDALSMDGEYFQRRAERARKVRA
jgi:hypothetical protein